MNCTAAIEERRSIRKFSRREISMDSLKEIIRCGGLAASGMNVQPIKYIIATGIKADEIFPHTRWAGYLKGKGSPTFEERPYAFILVLNDNNLRKSGYELDAGAAVQNILLSAVSMGLGTCWLGAIDYEDITVIAQIPDDYKLICAIAVGYPAQKSISEPSKGDIKYYLDEKGVLHVPKRNPDEIILKIY
ncbi:MAG: nitroreductase family protein [Clostridia bacterium]|nr:nitroreductase family protein [Clostridia bacterium]MBN2884223.1 nitroreductase family protein [Clostridia bacterium]